VAVVSAQEIKVRSKAMAEVKAAQLAASAESVLPLLESRSHARPRTANHHRLEEQNYPRQGRRHQRRTAMTLHMPLLPPQEATRPNATRRLLWSPTRASGSHGGVKPAAQRRGR